MNILFLSRLYYPHVGGVERHLRGLSRALSRRHNITIVTEKHDESLPDVERMPEALVYRISLKNVSEKSKKWVIWKWINTNQHLFDQADVIHAEDVYYWIIPYKILHPFKKSFVTFQGWECRYPIPHRFKLIRRIYELMADGNVCIGEFISKWYGTKPTIVSYAAV